MKLVTIMLTAAILQVSASTRAQRLTMKQEQTTLKEVFKQIRKQTGFSVLWGTDKLDATAKLDVDFSGATLDEVLRTCLQSSDFSYKIEEKTILISPKTGGEPLLSRIFGYFAAIDVYGRVVDEHGVGLSGATVRVKDQKNSVLTDAQGSFMLENVSEGAVIQVTYIGYKLLEAKAEKGMGVIQLELSSNKLDEVQVQAYGKTSRRLSTGNIVTIKGEELVKQPVSNPLLALQGRVPNMTVNAASGLPGAKITLQVRGQNSIGKARDRFGGTTNVNTEPLIIIDGVPYQNNLSPESSFKPNFGNLGTSFSALSMLNVADIEQIDILSDADATSIYGSRGGNGVILITTKKGNRGAMTVSARVNTGISQVPGKIELMNTNQYLLMRAQAYQNDNLPVPNHESGVKNLTNFDLTVWDPNRYTNWQDEFLGKSAGVTNANITLNGGSNILQYFISGNYNRQQYIFPGNDPNQSGMGTMSLTGTSADQRFTAGLSASYTYNYAKTASSDFTRLALTLAPNAPEIYNADGTLNWAANPDAASGTGTWKNPYAQLLNTAALSSSALRTSLNTSYRILDKLSVKVDAGYTQTRNDTRSLSPIAANDPSTISTGTHSFSTITANSLSLDPQLLYRTELGQGTLEALLGGSLQRQSQFNNYTVGSGYTSDALLGTLSAAGSFYAGSASSQYSYLAAFGRLNYNWRDRYILNLSGRRDGSSRFGPGNQFGNFYAASGAWIFTSETFMKRLPLISFGKLRASYGISGNDAGRDYGYLEYYNPIENYSYQGLRLIKSRGAVNSDYHWESIKKLEVAMDLGMFKDRLLLSAAFWRTRAGDQLGNLLLPNTAGAADITVNQDARIQNSGWDFTLNAGILKGNGLNWTTAMNFGVYSNKLLKAPESTVNPYGFSRFVVQGQPFSGFAVVYENQGVNPATGLYQFTDQWGTVNINGYPDAKKINTVPLTLGVSNSFKYKAFELSFFVQFTRQMGKNYLLDPVFVNPGSFSSGEVVVGNVPAAYLTAWHEQGDISAYQRYTSSYTGDPYRSQLGKAQLSDLAWVDASFIRLKNLYLSWQLPERWVRKAHFKNGRIFLQSQNLFTITGYEGLDPETQSLSALPLLRTIMGGIQFDF